VLCDEAGKVTFLDAATGAATGEQSLGEPLKSCVVSADGLAARAPTGPSQSLLAQLSEAVRNNDPEMVTGQRLLLRELAVQDDESATKTLVDLASDPRTPPLLVSDARAALAARRNGARFMTEALGRRYDFLRDVLRAPPVGPIAQALAAMKERSAAPALAAHLFDASDTDDDLKQAAAALVVLGDASQVSALTEFFTLYRASAPTDELAQAVVNAGQALLAIGAGAGRKTVDAALSDPMTLPLVKSRLGAIVESVDAEKSLARDKAKGSGKPSK
jgi:outer membrane protein assembly factor BamB